MVSVLTSEYIDCIFEAHIEPNHYLLHVLLPSYDPETIAGALLNEHRKGLNGALVNIDTEVELRSSSQAVHMENFFVHV